MGYWYGASFNFKPYLWIPAIKEKWINWRTWDEDFQQGLQQFGNIIEQALKDQESPVNYTINNNGVYLQSHKLYGEDDGYIPSYTEHYNPETIKKLKTLDIEVLKKLTQDLTPEYFQNPIWQNKILERRDQMLNHYEKQNKHPL